MFDFKDAEISELEAVALFDFVDDHIKEFLDDLFGDNAFVSGALCDLIDEDFLGDRFHGALSFSAWPVCVWVTVDESVEMWSQGGLFRVLREMPQTHIRGCHCCCAERLWRLR